MLWHHPDVDNVVATSDRSLKDSGKLSILNYKNIKKFPVLITI